MSTAASPRFTVQHVQLMRALFAAIAAVMITFSPDHSAEVGLSVFSGFGIATGLVWLLSAWLVFPAGRRVAPILLGVLSLVAGMLAGVIPLRSVFLYFAVVIGWALLTGIIELAYGWRALAQLRRLQTTEPGRFEAPAVARPNARDAVVIGILTLVLVVALLLTRADYVLEYFIPEAGQSFLLTGITIGVGVFGGYAAILAVYLGIAGFSPRHADADSAGSTPVDAAQNGESA